MPSQRKRTYNTADLHFVTFSCCHRQPNLSLPLNRDLFLTSTCEAKRKEKLRYMHQNPVARGSVENPEDGQWSSFRHHAFDELSVVTVESSWLNVWRQSVNPTLRKSAKDGVPEHLL
jgi:hypothetical protein